MQDQYNNTYPQESYQNVPVRSDEIYANIMQEDRVKNTIAQTSPDNQLVDIEWRLRGYKKNIYTGQWDKISEKAPEINSILIARYIGFLGSVMSDNARFTNLSSLNINKIMKLVSEYLVDDLDSNAALYNLECDYTERTRIGLMILNTTFFVLKRAENGMEARRIWNSIDMHESINQLPQTKKGFLDNLAFWKR